MADRFGMERPTYFPSLFVLLPPPPQDTLRLWRASTTTNDVAQFTSRRKYGALRGRQPEKRKKERARRMETRRAALLERLGNESFVDGRVRVDHKKRITGTMSGYG